MDLKLVLQDMARAIVDTPDAVSVTEREEEDGHLVLTLSVAEDDTGMVIGHHGKIANSLRAIMKAAAAECGRRVVVKIQGSHSGD